MFSPARLALTARRHSLWLLWCCLAVVLPQALWAATPREELLRFVPENSGFCLIFQDVRTHWSELLASPFAEQVRRSPLGALTFPLGDKQKLEKMEKALLRPLELTWPQLRRDDVLGEAVIFVYRPGPPDKPQLEQGLVLIRAQKAKTLVDLVERFNEAQKKSGMLKELEEREHNGVKYYRRVDTRETSYYHLRGPILLMTAQEEILRSALDSERTLPTETEPILTRTLRQLGAERGLLTFWINPRAFDEAVAARAAKGNEAEAQIHKTVATYWKALEGLALSVTLDKDFSVQLAVRARLEQLPSSTRRFLTEAARPSPLWRLFPDNALLAVAGRSDAAALLEILGDFLPAKTRQGLHADLNRGVGAAFAKDFVKEVLPFLGPDFGLCLTAPAAQDRGWFPQVLFALKVSEGNPGAPVDKAVLSAVHFLAFGASIAHNQQQPEKPITLKEITLDRREIKFLSGDGAFPPGVQPAFGLHAGYLLLASMPEVIRRFGATEAPELNGAVPVLRVGIKEWRAYLDKYREEVLKALTAKNELTQAEAAQRLDRLLLGLQFLDRVEIRQQTSQNQTILTLALQPAQPLKKDTQRGEK